MEYTGAKVENKPKPIASTRMIAYHEGNEMMATSGEKERRERVHWLMVDGELKFCGRYKEINAIAELRMCIPKI